MKTNMGSTDKVIRILVAVAILVLYFTDKISGTLAIIGLVLSAVFMLTSLLGFCPLYLPFGISTKRRSRLGDLNKRVINYRILFG
ncbi:MAG: DUF2892 domain-containing protein [Sphingobacteriaceae bacterium]|nr:DUF2892 domain-containing protein [Sphingobacteriaceae bacterium]